MTLPASVLDRVSHLPESPGVYLWKDVRGEVLYVGKAKRLRSRVRSYLAAERLENTKTRVLMRQVADLETIVVPTEPAALILESNLIKEHRPRYNVVLRDDKSYPYIKVTVQEPFPRVLVTRRLLNDGARYFGPYTDVGAMRRAINVVKRIFTVRSCHYDMPRQMPDRPCLDYYIKRCKAPCVFLQSQADYRAMIDEVLVFLDGRTDEVIRRVRGRMDAAAAALDFERAAELRDALKHLDRMEEPTVVLEVEGGDRDVIGFARDGDEACVALLRIRGGKLLGREHQFVAHVEGESDGAALSAYLVGAYRPMADHAPELFLPFASEDPELAQASLAPVRLVVPLRGPEARPGGARRAERPPSAGGGAAGRRRDERARRRSGVRTAAPARPAETAAHPRLLRRLARPGHRHGGVVRLVPERAAASGGVSQVQGEDRGGDRRLRVDARSGGAVFRPPRRGWKAAARPGGDRRRQGAARGGAPRAGRTRPRRDAVDQPRETRGGDLRRRA